MYQEVKNLEPAQQVDVFVRTLVAKASVNGTDGERTIADTIESIIRSFPYFTANPAHVWTTELQQDKLKRKNVFAFVKAKKSSSKTVIYHAHMDTVGIEDFGALKDLAFSPDALLEFFSQYKKLPIVQHDARSGDWLFGRGSLDMKGGIAVHLTNLLYFSEFRDECDGNLLVMFNPVEENQHTGVIEAISELKRLRSEQGLVYALAVNDDFVSPLYEGDQHRYVYTGAVGKLLACFYIRGREAHVGETLKGIDPTMISSEINTRINNNMAFSESLTGEVVLPPSCLYQRDLKDFYNVQTAGKCHLYFNYFLYRASSSEVMDRLVSVAREACMAVETRLEENYQKYAQVSGLPTDAIGRHVEVLSYKNFVERLTAKGVDTEKVAADIVSKHKDMEPRMLCFKIIEALDESDIDRAPRVVIFYAPPYCPHNYVSDGDGSSPSLKNTLREVISQFGEDSHEQFVIKNFFPYLSDSSYLSLQETADEQNALIGNFPGWQQAYSVPLDDIRQLGIPSINVGVYGQDAHQWTERIYTPYSFGVVPRLIREITKAVWTA